MQQSGVDQWTAATATSYKRSSRQDSNNPQQQQQLRGCLPNGTRPKKIRCRCGQDFFDFAARPNGSMNQTPYKTCRDCFLKQKKDSREKTEVRMMFATLGGRMELKVKDAVADSGTQITIFPASLIEASGIQLSGLNFSGLE